MKKMGIPGKFVFALLATILLAACAKKASQPEPTVDVNPKAAPEAALDVAPKIKSGPVQAEKWMIAVANPLAAEAGREILRAGGSAVDAAVTAQMVLNLVEPQSSGIGGGAFMMHLDAQSGQIAAYDGREKAPEKAHPKMFLGQDGAPRKFFDAAVGGLSVGVPGVLKMLEMAHKEHGKLPWAKLFDAAITKAEKGFAVSPRLHGLITKDRFLKVFPATANYFHDSEGAPLAVGHILKNQPFADTLRNIAENGADAFYSGEVARNIIDTVSNASQNPGLLTMDDMLSYKAVKRDPVCLFYRLWLVCGMGPPSSGGLTTLQILGILQSYDLAQMKPDADGLMSSHALHLIAEASKLAFADRNTYIADPDFVPVPGLGMLDPGYLELRAAEISPNKAFDKAFPGMPGLSTSWNFSGSTDEPGLSTTHISIIDGAGNAVSMTSSIENAFGSRMMSGGFLLNNQLTDFSFVPERDGAPVVNRAEADKRPRSSMAPTLVIDGEGKVVLAIGSPGGSRIIGYVAQAIIAALDWDMDIQSALDMPHMTNRNGSTDLEAGTGLEQLKADLEALGHTVQIKDMASGLHAVQVKDGKLLGAADYRREGVALGD
ncbi:MAG: gamma-glutamyltransferase [Rhodospirillaceae bacterium]|nr:gamma-glutamyltransferase [Rhodospirillaceae bacterium]MBL6940815.1 gamma-glutamyltransferase [Rhodospirillales bacterium]